jgi:hypothetical protein
MSWEDDPVCGVVNYHDVVVLFLRQLCTNKPVTEFNVNVRHTKSPAKEVSSLLFCL